MTQPAPARSFEAGLLRPLDGFIHASRRRPGGSAALCGAGRIETHLVGRFDPAANDACPMCLIVLAAEPD